MDQVQKFFIDVVLPGVLTAIGGFAVQLIRTQIAKAGVQLTTEQDERLRALAFEAMHAVEEIARKKAGSEEPMSSDEKHEAAIDHIVAAARVSREAAERVLHSQLGESRLLVQPQQ